MTNEMYRVANKKASVDIDPKWTTLDLISIKLDGFPAIFVLDSGDAVTTVLSEETWLVGLGTRSKLERRVLGKKCISFSGPHEFFLLRMLTAFSSSLCADFCAQLSTPEEGEIFGSRFFLLFFCPTFPIVPLY